MNDSEEAKNNFFDQVQFLRDFMVQIDHSGYTGHIFSLKEELFFDRYDLFDLYDIYDPTTGRD